MGQAKNTILIVDDVELNRDVLSIMFSQRHEIEFAESGPEALDILRKKKEDICAILLDYVMPEMDGLTFLEEAIKEGLVESIPVFLITASLSMTLCIVLIRWAWLTIFSVRFLRTSLSAV